MENEITNEEAAEMFRLAAPLAKEFRKDLAEITQKLLRSISSEPSEDKRINVRAFCTMVIQCQVELMVVTLRPLMDDLAIDVAVRKSLELHLSVNHD